MTVITELYCQLNIKCQLHVSGNTIFCHQVGYNYRRKLHNIYIYIYIYIMIQYSHQLYCIILYVVYLDGCLTVHLPHEIK